MKRAIDDETIWIEKLELDFVTLGISGSYGGPGLLNDGRAIRAEKLAHWCPRRGRF